MLRWTAKKYNLCQYPNISDGVMCFWCGQTYRDKGCPAISGITNSGSVCTKVPPKNEAWTMVSALGCSKLL